MSVALVVLSALVGTGYAVAAVGHKSASDVIKLAKVSVSSGSKTVKTSALVNSSGRAVYMLSGDSVKHPKCTSQSCLSAWPAVTTSSMRPAVGSGVSGAVTVWHHNGISQVVLAGHPLYTFAGDPGADQAKGEGLTSFGGTWKVVGGSGSAVAMSASSGSGGGGGW
jgi:predicted lipoprotein with Yx(FWY)xxD motif